VNGHRYQTRVYYADTDAGGVVYHATYLDMAERARTEALRDAGLPHAQMLAEHDCHFMVRRIHLEYFRPARLDDLVTIRTSTVSTGGATITLRQEFTGADDSALARLEVQLACVNARSGRPVRVPPKWKTGMAAPGQATN
jgi:acyl-CoA thioester hydrolase